MCRAMRRRKVSTKDHLDPIQNSSDNSINCLLQLDAMAGTNGALHPTAAGQRLTRSPVTRPCHAAIQVHAINSNAWIYLMPRSMCSLTPKSKSPVPEKLRLRNSYSLTSRPRFTMSTCEATVLRISPVRFDFEDSCRSLDGITFEIHADVVSRRRLRSCTAMRAHVTRTSLRTY